MHVMGLLDVSLPKAMRGEVSSIAPTPAFEMRVRELGITLGDFGRDEREEVLVLTRNAARGQRRSGIASSTKTRRRPTRCGTRCGRSTRSSRRQTSRLYRMDCHLTGLGLTPEQYREKWNLPADFPMVAPNYAAKRSALAKKIGLG
jgi:ROS/MUCR transcriptional regulator protein